MLGQYYFLLTSLPELPDLGQAPPIDLREFRRLAMPEASAASLIDVVLLERDLLLRESALAGETDKPEGLVLTDGQVAGQDPLPDFLAAPTDRQRRIAGDTIWEAYYRHVHRTAIRRHSAFLRDWAGFEVALRNALVTARAARLGLDAEEYLVAEGLAAEVSAVDEAVSAWTEAPDPLAALRVLDERRWQWIEEHAGYYTFEVDELLAYARKLVLAARWQVLGK